MHDNKIIAIMQYVILWVSLFVMMALFVFLFRVDLKIPQTTVTTKIDITNKVNVCLPDDPDFPQDD